MPETLEDILASVGIDPAQTTPVNNPNTQPPQDDNLESIIAEVQARNGFPVAHVAQPEPIETSRSFTDADWAGTQEAAIEDAKQRGVIPWLLAKSGLQNITSGVKSGVESAGSGVAGIGELFGVPGMTEERQRLQAQMQDTLAQSGRESGNSVIGRIPRNVAKTVTEMALLSPVGRGAAGVGKLAGLGTKAQAVIQAATSLAPAVGAQAATQAEESGLTGGSKAGYVASQIGSEAIPTALMTFIGMPGLDALFLPNSGQLLRGAFRQQLATAAKLGIEEIPEELASDLANRFVDRGFLPEQKNVPIGNLIIDFLKSAPETAATAFLAPGATVAAGAGVNALAQPPTQAPAVRPTVPVESTQADQLAAIFDQPPQPDVQPDVQPINNQTRGDYLQPPTPTPAFEGGPQGGGISEQPGGMTPEDAATALAALFGQHQDQSVTLQQPQTEKEKATELQGAVANRFPLMRPYIKDQGPVQFVGDAPDAKVASLHYGINGTGADQALDPMRRVAATAWTADQQQQYRRNVRVIAMHLRKTGAAADGTFPLEKLLAVQDQLTKPLSRNEAQRLAEQISSPTPVAHSNEKQANTVPAPTVSPESLPIGKQVDPVTAPAPVAPPIQKPATSSPSQAEHYRAFVASLSPEERTAVAADLKAVGDTPADPFSAMQGIRQSLEMAKAVAERRAKQAAESNLNNSTPVVTQPTASQQDIKSTYKLDQKAVSNAPPQPASQPRMDAESRGLSRPQTEPVPQASPVAGNTTGVQAGNRTTEPVSPTPVPQAQPAPGEKLAGQRTESAATGKPVAGWQAFSPESGTLGVPRADMPQIKSEQRGALANFLRSRGIDFTREEMPAGSLKPTQAEYAPNKVDKARKFTGEQRAILVSSDGYVVDGHHQWMAALDHPERPIPVIKLGAPINEALAAVSQFPSAETASGAKPQPGIIPQNNPASKIAPTTSQRAEAAPVVSDDSLVARHRYVSTEADRWDAKVADAKSAKDTTRLKSAVRNRNDTRKVLASIEGRMTPDELAQVRGKPAGNTRLFAPERVPGDGSTRAGGGQDSGMKLLHGAFQKKVVEVKPGRALFLTDDPVIARHYGGVDAVMGDDGIESDYNADHGRATISEFTVNTDGAIAFSSGKDVQRWLRDHGHEDLAERDPDRFDRNPARSYTWVEWPPVTKALHDAGVFVVKIKDDEVNLANASMPHEHQSWAITGPEAISSESKRLYQQDRIPGEDTALESQDRTPGEPEEPSAMPSADTGIEPLIAWALKERAKTIGQMRKRADRGGDMAEEYAKTQKEYKSVTPEALAKDMREFPNHYLHLMSARGGNLSPVAVYRNRLELPPQQPRIQVDAMPPIDGQAPDLLATMKTLREDLQRAAPGAPTFDVDKGALPEAAGGQFDTRSGAITTRYHNDLDLVAHEVGHWAAETYDLLPEESDIETRSELARFAVHGSKAKGETAQREGMAEYLRAWMVNPGEAETRAPHFAQRMRQLLPGSVAEALQTYGKAIRGFEGSTALQKMAAGQQQTTAAIAEQQREGRWWMPIITAIRESLGLGIGTPKARAGMVPDAWEADTKTRAKFHLTDKEAPQLANYLLSLTLTGRDPSKVNPSEHWDFLRRGMRGVSAKIRDGVARFGLPNQDGTVAKDPKTGQAMALPWLLEPAMDLPSDQFGAFMDKAHAYGSAQRTLELADRFTTKAEYEIERFTTAAMEEASDPFRRQSAEARVKQFADERRKQLRRQLARLTAAGGGIRSAAEVARQAVAEMQKDPQRKDVEEYLRRYRAWADWNLDYAVRSDLMSPTQAETIRQANQFYIDWHRVFADEDGPVNLGEAVQGSSRTMHNPLASLLHATWGTITRGDRNRATLAFVAPLRGQGDSQKRSLASLGRTISREAAEEAKTKHHGYHDDGTGQKQRVYSVQRVVQAMNEDGSPATSPNGESLQTVESEPWVFDAATEASLEAMRADSGDSLWHNFTQGLINLQRMAITSAPGFRFKVPVRDNIDRLMNTEAGSSIADAGRGMRKTLTDPLTGEELDLDRLYHQSGAGMAGWNRRTREQALADVMGTVEDLRKKGYRVLTPSGALRWWQAVGEKSENIARKAEFVAAFKKGRTQLGYSQLDASLYAMTQARGLLDTAESGKSIAQLNRVFLFMNAATKGLERMTKISRSAATAYRRGDIATGNRLAALTAVRLGVWGASLAATRLMMLAMMDDDDQEEFMEQPAWKRDFSIILPDFGLGKIAIPKGYEWGFLGSGFERLADAAWATGKASQAQRRGDEAAATKWQEHATRAGDGWGHSGVTALLPFKFDDVLGGGLAPIAEVAFNRSLFTGGVVIPQNEAEKKLALRKRADEASLVGRGLSAILAPIIGERFGDPRSVDHLLRGYLGGWGSVGTARDMAEVMRRFTGYSGETSAYAERDTGFVLDWAAENGVGSRKAFTHLRELAKTARNATGADQDQALQRMRTVAQTLRRGIEEKKITAAKP